MSFPTRSLSSTLSLKASLVSFLISLLLMPPKRAAKKPSTASTTTKGKGATGSKQFTAADAKQLAELQKAQKAARAAEQEELKNGEISNIHCALC